MSAAPTSASCICEICKHKRDFEMPIHLLDKVKSGEAIVFAGAGASTESRLAHAHTFYDEIAHEMKVSPGKPFPQLMSDYCKQPDGRQRLLQRFQARLNYFKAFPELYRDATRFHRQLATMHTLDTIVTTNWDDYFEKECGATPYVSAEDFALWGMPGRKVFKIHGSINNLGSIVATTEDYAKCYRKLSTGVVGSILKKVLATNTIIYVGYSFTDEDFLKIHHILSSEMRGLRPHAYFVTLDEGAKKRLEKLQITLIVTEGAHFLERLKEHLVAKDVMLSDEVFDGLKLTYAEVAHAHHQVGEISLQRFPAVVYTLAYQDGLMHCLERITAMQSTGEYSDPHRVHMKIHTYQAIWNRARKAKRHTELAYVDGYLNGLIFLLASPTNRRGLPMYFLLGARSHPATFKEYRKRVGKVQARHKAAQRAAAKIVEQKTKGVPGIVVHHSPFLFSVAEPDEDDGLS